jgi:hypothetical protein
MSRVQYHGVQGLVRGIVKAVALIQGAQAARKQELAIIRAEISRRGGETSIEGKYGTETLRLTDESRDEHGRLLVVYHCEGWRQYGSRHPARLASLSYLCGTDDNGPFAVRIAGTITTVSAAIAWLTPAAARKPGTVRQGNVYAVPYHGDKPVTVIGRHCLCHGELVDGDNVYLIHSAPEGRVSHATILLSGAGWTLVAQRRLDTVRGRTRD